MLTIQVYDPPMCCSTGICGTTLDPDLVNFAALLSRLKKRGIHIERYNLSQQPLAFAQNPAVKAVLGTDGPDALPLILWNGEEKLRGRYPNAEERLAWVSVAEGALEAVS